MIKKLLFSASFALLSIGCGGSDRSVDEDKAHEATVKLDRSKWEDVNKPAESSLGLLSKSLDNALLEIKLQKGQVVGNHIQFYIDTDYNEGTGYKNDWIDGADYLIEDGRVYKSTASGPRWHWEKIGKVTLKDVNGEIYTSVTQALIPNIDKNFRVAALSLSNHWHIVSNISMKPISRNAISIDADVSDWNEIPVLASSQVGALKVTSDSQRVYMLLQNGNIGKHTQIYINSDNDATTGYISSKLSNSGADYLIEDNRLYKSTANGKRWNWKNIGLVGIAKDNNILEISIKKSEIGIENVNTFNLGIIAWNASYDKTVSTLDMHQSDLNNLQTVVISEVLAENAHTKLDPDFATFSDWIEIHNQSAKEIDIGNYMLSDKLDKATWSIAKGTKIPAHGYKIFWADKKDTIKKAQHTNFSLKSKGEAVALFDAEKNLLSGFKFDKQLADVSCISNNGNIAYMTPTPALENSDTVDNLELSTKPTILLTNIANANVAIEISSENDAEIYYTTDGSFPTLSSEIYTQPILYDETTIIRARAKENGKLLSYASTKSYFVGEATELPVMSIVTDDKYLFDDTIGIYTIGTNGAKTPGCSMGPQVANFYQKWKRPANIEYLDENKQRIFSQEVDIKISGSCSRAIAQKSFSISAKKKYGKNTISHTLFPNKDRVIEGFKLKNAGQDWWGGMLRDAFLHQVIKDSLDIEYQDYKPCVVYINGKYWGIHNIREKKNEDFLANNHEGVDADKIDILKNNMKVNEGTNKNYKEMIKFIQENTISLEENYEKLSSMMDMENYIDYIIAETYFANADWPYTNIRYWREKNASPKWRWILEDLDLAMGQWGDDINVNMFDFITQTDNLNDKNPLWSTFLFRSLVQNGTFKNRFKEKYESYLDSTFQTNRLNTILDNLTAKIESEIPSHIQRWSGYNPHAVGGSTGSWKSKIKHLKDVISTRNQTVKDELAAF